MGVFAQGVTLLLVGMGILFAAMALLMLAIFLLERQFRPRRFTPGEHPPEDGELISSAAREIEDEETAAAIAVALTHWRCRGAGSGNLGLRLESDRGLWWTMGRTQSRPANARQGRRQS